MILLPPPRRPVALALMTLAPVLWSLAGVATRAIERAGAFELVFWRSLCAAIFVAAALAALHGRAALAALHHFGLAGLASSAMWAVMFSAFMISLTLTTTANVLVMSSIGPLFTALLAFVLLREPVAARTWIAIGAAAAGMGLMFGAGVSAAGGRHLAGMLIALSVPVAGAANLILLRRWGAHVDLMPAVLFGALLSSAFTLPWALPGSASARDLAILAALGAIQLGLPCMLLVFASRTLRAHEIALLALLEIVLGPLWAWLGAGEAPAAATLAGGAIVLAALAGDRLAEQRSVLRVRLS